MQEFTVFVAEPFPRADFFVVEIHFGTFKHLIHVHMNVFSAVTFDQSEETCISAWFQLQEAPHASYFTSDDNGFGCKCGEKTSKRNDARRPSALHGCDDVVDCGDLFSAEQKELLNLIEKQDVNEVRQFFAQGPAFDVSKGEIGRVALRLAIDNERADIAEVLLEKGVRVGNALFAAVIAGSRECVELVLDSRFFNESRGDIGPTDQPKRFFMSPLMLAVRLKEHDIIQYMLSKGSRIKHPDKDQLENQLSSDLQEEMQFLHINS